MGIEIKSFGIKGAGIKASDGYYMPVDQWIALQDPNLYDWRDDAAKLRAIENNEVWTIHWYPNSPVGFQAVAAPTLFECIQFAADPERE